MLALLLGALALAGTLQIDILDIGQGDAILLRSPEGRVVLIDGGTGGDPVPPMLAARGVERIDLMIATHPHADHIGGLDEVIAALPVGLYIDSGQTHTTASYDRLMDLIEQRDVPYMTAEPGQILNLGAEVTIELIHPQITLLSGTRSDLNSNSVVARVTHGDSCFLFTGDAEDPTERVLMQRGLQPCDVLKVAHHGGAHSTSDAWLRAVQPTIALISAGQNNRYGHPTEETLSRLDRAGATTYRTDTMGAIHLESDGTTITVTTEREDDAPPRRITTASTPHTPEPAPQPPAAAGALVNVNTASQSELETLPGIGPSKAGAIIEHRSTHGPFVSIEQLDDVPGIGPATMSNIRPLVGLGDSDAAPPPAQLSAPNAAPPPSSSPEDASGRINVNTASQSVLEGLPGIGPSKARAIIEFRSSYGPFTSCDDLTRVSGIKEKTLDKLRDSCTVKGEQR